MRQRLDRLSVRHTTLCLYVIRPALTASSAALDRVLLLWRAAVAVAPLGLSRNSLRNDYGLRAPPPWSCFPAAARSPAAGATTVCFALKQQQRCQSVRDC